MNIKELNQEAERSIVIELLSTHHAMVPFSPVNHEWMRLNQQLGDNVIQEFETPDTKLHLSRGKIGSNPWRYTIKRYRKGKDAESFGEGRFPDTLYQGTISNMLSYYILAKEMGLPFLMPGEASGSDEFLPNKRASRENQRRAIGNDRLSLH